MSNGRKFVRGDNWENETVGNMQRVHVIECT